MMATEEMVDDFYQGRKDAKCLMYSLNNYFGREVINVKSLVDSENTYF